MLEELYGYMQGLQSFERDTLLDEEPETMQRRAAIKQVQATLLEAAIPACQIVTMEGTSPTGSIIKNQSP